MFIKISDGNPNIVIVGNPDEKKIIKVEKD